MTTGRINQVTILNAAGVGRGDTPSDGAAQFTDGGRSPRPVGPWSSGYNRARPAIRLPPLSFPRGRPPHRGRAPSAPTGCDLGPSGGGCLPQDLAPRRGGSLPGLASKCLGRAVPSGQPSTDSNRARHASAGESSGTSASQPRGAGLHRWQVAASANTAGSAANSQQQVSGRATMRRVLRPCSPQTTLAAEPIGIALARPEDVLRRVEVQHPRATGQVPPPRPVGARKSSYYGAAGAGQPAWRLTERAGLGP